MSFLQLRNPGVQFARGNNAVLRGKKILGRGMFAAVFEGRSPDTVLKMTTCQYSYWMLNCSCCAVRNPMFPRLIENFGEIGEMKLHGISYPIWLYEVERLQKVAPSSPQKRLRRKIIHKVASEALPKSWAVPSEFMGQFVFDHLACDEELPEDVRDAMGELADFCSNYPGARADLAGGNFMQRSDGQLVINDPVFDVKARDHFYASQRRLSHW